MSSLHPSHHRIALMDNKKVDTFEQQAPPPHYDDATAIIDQVCEDATLKGAVLTMSL